MATIDVPEGEDPQTFVYGRSPQLGAAARAFAMATLRHTSLPLRELEAARYRVAQINDCRLCLGYRTRRDGTEPVGEDLYAAVGEWRTASGLTERERLAAEYAERYALDHQNLDTVFWVRMRAAYTDDEIVELSLCVAEWLGIGRLNRVLGIDGTCEL